MQLTPLNRLPSVPTCRKKCYAIQLSKIREKHFRILGIWKGKHFYFFVHLQPHTNTPYVFHGTRNLI